MAVVLLAFAFASFPAGAYRPFDGTDAAVAAKGELEIELGPVGLVSTGGDRALLAPSLIVNWGLAQRMELVLEGKQFFTLKGPAGEASPRLEDTALSLKAVLRPGVLQEGTGPSVAAELGVLLPAVNGESGVGAQVAVIGSQRWSWGTLHLNAAGGLTRGHDLLLSGGAIVEGPEAWPVRPVAEAFVQRLGDVDIGSVLAGVIFRAGESLAFDAGARLATVGGTRELELRLGLTFAFGVGFPKRSLHAR